MAKWSKLQRDLYNLIKETDKEHRFQIHCVAYRMPKSISSNPQIPRYWITIGKEIVWDTATIFNNYSYEPQQKIGKISQSIRDYINCPLKELKSKQDEYGLYDILRKYDRRF